MNKSELYNDQYKTDSKLNIRIALHNLYRTNKVEMWDWLWSHYTFNYNENVLEVGCGTGDFWKHDKLNQLSKINLTMTDFSDGMIKSANDNLKNDKIKFKVEEIENLSFESDSFNKVLSHMMMYHVPNKDKAFSEVKRVLKKDGIFFVLTSGDFHMKRLLGEGTSGMNDSFAETKADELTKKYFTNIEKHSYEDELKITSFNHAADYLSTSPGFVKANEEFKKAHLNKIENEIKTKGYFSVPKKIILYVCKN